jgi:hypothetical protein
MPVETMTSNTIWPSLNESHGNSIPESSNTSNNEWEMIAENEEEINGNNRHVVILPTDGNISSKDSKGRPRSATVGGEGAIIAAESNRVLKECGSFGDSAKGSDVCKVARRSLRRCASTPDLLVSDNDHEIIVEDESDEEEDEVETSDEGDLIEEDESVEDETVEDYVGDVETQEAEDVDDSFEVVSEKNDDSDAILIDEDTSMGTSSWTLPSAATAPNAATTSSPVSAWGSKSAPSFKDILAKNADKPMSWGCDKQKTEAMLRDSHRRHHLRVRTKPKFVVAGDTKGSGMLTHAHSTGDLTKLMEMAEQERRGGRGRMKKQFSALMEDDDEGDFVIGRGNAASSGGGGGDAMGADQVMGDTDAMDFYHRKEKGSQATSNKKKERPDEAKRKEISMYKKELQREKQQLKSKGGGNAGADGSSKKKKNEKGFGGKKERRRL